MYIKWYLFRKFAETNKNNHEYGYSDIYSSQDRGAIDSTQ